MARGLPLAPKKGRKEGRKEERRRASVCGFLAASGPGRKEVSGFLGRQGYMRAKGGSGIGGNEITALLHSPLSVARELQAFHRMRGKV